MKFTLETELPVAAPYRLDLTADALRRLAANLVDVVDNGVYRRLLQDERGANLLEVTQPSTRRIAVRLTGSHAERWLPAAARMLGTGVRLTGWEKRTAAFPWLAFLARELRGLPPPRYPTLWEAFAHAIVFQQISIHAAASIMRRTIEALSPPHEQAGHAYYAFFTPQAVLGAPERTLRAAGLSANKIAHLRSAAHSIADGAVGESELDALSTPAAAQRLVTVRGIGPWSAAVVLLRGMGRLDVFPMKDSGVARAIRLLSGNPETDVDAVLAALGPLRGMLYYHLLLGRTRNLTQPAVPAEGL